MYVQNNAIGNGYEVSHQEFVLSDSKVNLKIQQGFLSFCHISKWSRIKVCLFYELPVFRTSGLKVSIHLLLLP